MSLRADESMMKYIKTLKSRPALIALVAIALVLIPALALAIPGSGDFTALHSPTGREMTRLYNLLAKVCLVIFAIVSSVMLVAIVKFRRRSDDEMPAQIHGNMKVEMGLLVAATALQVYIGWQTIGVMWYVEKMPELPAGQKMMTVEAIGYRWDWKFRYPDHGGLITEDLVIPAHVPVKLEITSEDVIHSLFIPELGVKMDAVPGRINYWWVNADGPVNQRSFATQRGVQAPERDILPTTRPKDSFIAPLFNALTLTEVSSRPEQITGLEKRITYLAASRQVGEVSPYAAYDAVEYRGMCTELCGKGHYDMYFRTVVMTQASFDKWLVDRRTGGGGEPDGAGLYNSKCATCHGADGQGSGSAFPPLTGERVKQDTDEHKNYHIEVVLKGLQGQIVVNGQTYNGAMQPWYNVLNDAEVAAVVNHERTSWGNNGGEVTIEQVAELRKSLGFPPFPAGGAEPIDEGALASEGEAIYAACSSCHGDDGKSTLTGVPNIAANPKVLSSPDAVVRYLLLGTAKKSAQGQSMTDREIAAILTYIRKDFGNQASGVQPDEVARLRAEIQK